MRERVPTEAECASDTCKASLADDMETGVESALESPMPRGLAAKAIDCWCAGHIKLNRAGAVLETMDTTVEETVALCAEEGCKEYSEWNTRIFYAIICIFFTDSCPGGLGEIDTIARDTQQCTCNMATQHDFIPPDEGSDFTDRQSEAYCADEACRRVPEFLNEAFPDAGIETCGE